MQSDSQVTNSDFMLCSVTLAVLLFWFSTLTAEATAESPKWDALTRLDSQSMNFEAQIQPDQSDPKMSLNDDQAQDVQTERDLTSHSLLDAGVRMTASLLLVLALLAAGVFLLKKISPYKRFISNAKQPISVLSRITIGSRKHICLVEIGNEILVVGLTNNNMFLISKMNADDFYKESSFAKDTYSTSAGYKHSFRKLLDKLEVWNSKTLPDERS